MKLLSFLPLIAASSSTEVYDSQTIVSITSDDTFVDVKDIPQRLEAAKLASNTAMAAFLKTATIKTLKYSGLQVVSTSDDTVSCTALCDYVKDAASKLHDLEYDCAPNYTTREESTGNKLGVNDPNAEHQKAFERMNMKEVWEKSAPYARQTVSVAVMDSGLNFSDPDIAPYRGIFRTKSGGIVDGGWNFVNDTSNFSSVNQHGQMCAKLIASRRNDNHDMAGMSNHVRLVSLRTQNEDGYGSWWHMAEAMEMAVDIGVDIVSISLGYFISRSFADRVLGKAFKAATDQGIIVVASAGNDGLPADMHYPCPIPGVLCVAALKYQDDLELYSWSNYGGYVDIAAYGQYIYTGNNGYASGTSFSCPIVSGAAALMLSMGVKPKYVAGILAHNVDRFTTPGMPLKKNAGALNPLKAVEMAIDFPVLRGYRR